MKNEYSRIFFDTAPIIYFVEQKEKYFTHIKNFLKTNYLSEYYTSTISVAEYSLYPYLYDKSLLSKYNQFIDIMGINVININKNIADKSAQIKSQYRYFKTADSLQLASAMIYNCDLFITNDKQLRKFSEVETIILDDLL